ncbi:putative Ribosomal protein L7Ae/L30e/S12e/Gadd45 family protein [Melia azedarach]|uniref:Ribosomal protein L7Ae/L30e/S12e/Gadd45 family protein n=1 Tax=Melia azedarach TaxID=155640 RepID=A0ACC1YW36_MELAZ|nr:putative Ribosomal protein L7Ae/L30e/S12e/Gadd45 family protein [Melia azedarach]
MNSLCVIKTFGAFRRASCVQSVIMQSGKKASKKLVDVSKPPSSVPQEPECYEGERLARLLKLIQREIRSARISDGDSLPEKIWFKQQFSIGVNEVTRVLERMAPIANVEISHRQCHVFRDNSKGRSVELQVILLAADCNPRWLTKHLPTLALSRNVPVIFVKDKKGGSLRLGELVKLKTAIAIGIKEKGNAVNQIVEKILRGDEINLFKMSETPLHPVKDLLGEAHK